MSMWRRIRGVLAAGSLILAAAGLQAQFSGPALGASPETNRAQPPTTDLAILSQSGIDPLIAPGDLVSVRVFGTNDFASPVRVSVDGNLQLPLIGLVQVGGLTINRAEDLIAARLSAAGMYVNPQVTVQVSESVSQFATVAGELHAIVPINGSRRLLDVLAVAGSLPASASHVITILRQGQEKPIVVDLGTNPAASAQADIEILPGDKVLISRVGVIYVLGAFKNQGAIPLQQTSPLTLIEATTLAGGVGYEGKFKDLRIIRTTGLTRNVVTVDIKAILNGKAPDPILQADDIVFLPSDALKAAIKSGGIGTALGVIDVLVIALQNHL